MSQLFRASKFLHQLKSYSHVAEQEEFHQVGELHREGTAPAACAAGLFLDVLASLFLMIVTDKLTE